MAAVTICSDFGAQENKVCQCFHCFLIYLPWWMGLDTMIIVFWMLSFKSSAYLRLLIFLLEAHVSSNLVFCVMYSVYELTKQGDNIQPWHTPFLIWKQSIVSCLVLTCFLICIQVSQEAGKVMWSGIPVSFWIFHSLLWSTCSKALGVVSKAKVDVFSGALTFLMIQQILAIWSLFPLPFLNPSWTSESSWFTYYWSWPWRILSITLLACEISTTVQ